MCYKKQTGYALFARNGDFRAVFALCAGVKRPFRAPCDEGLGTSVAVHYLKEVFVDRDLRRLTAQACALGPTRPARARCVAGAVRALINYRETCLDKQTTYALYVTDSDFAQVFDLCSRIERDVRGACYRGLGGDVAVDAAKHLFDARARALSRKRLCLLGADRSARRECVIGAVRVILRDLAGGAAQTAAFCRALGAGDLRRVCVRARDEAYRELPLQPDAELAAR